MKRTTRHTPAWIVTLFILIAAGCTGTKDIVTAELPTTTQPTHNTEAPATQASTVSGPQATIPINGMACPFCTYNIQRQIQALDGVEQVDVSLEKGEASVILSEQDAPTAQQLRGAVESAGFTPGEVQMP